jgi:hypothetical protein
MADDECKRVPRTRENPEPPLVPPPEPVLVRPLCRCPHLARALAARPPPASAFSTDSPCAACAAIVGTAAEAGAGGGAGPSPRQAGELPPRENWICCACFAVGCGRYCRAHALEHAEAAGHCVALSLADLSFWCYACEAYLDVYNIRAL